MNKQVRDSLVWGALVGAAAGAVLFGALGAVAGAVIYAPIEAIGAARRKPAQPKPLLGRIVASAVLMALFGWLLGLILDVPVFIGLVSGGLLGALGLRRTKIALGLLVGAGVALVLEEPQFIAAATTVIYRSLTALLYRGREHVKIMAEEVPADELRYVVPFEARTKYVGADYVEQLAALKGGTFKRNPPDVGILASLDALDGPTFAPTAVHPLIREFYEHTSRFKLSIIPEWRPWMKPVYAVFKRTIAEPLGQAAIPSNIEEAQRGMVSTIDTIDLDDDEEIEIRGWIRTFADSGKPIYVGIYTSFRHEDRGYVSVGFPIPSANFTATLLPRNAGADEFLLTSKTDLPFPGHYLSAVNDGALTVIKLLAFQEQIHVFVRGGELKTEHSFSLLGARFLTLHYEISRIKAEPSAINPM